MDLKELKEYLVNKLNKNMPSKYFLDKMRVLDEDSRKTTAYQDPKYIPFYYWLGTKIEPESIIEFGFHLGLFSACFLKGCKTVKKVLGFQEKTEEFYSPRLGIANVKDYYKGDVYVHVGKSDDDAFESKLNQSNWDLFIINYRQSYDKHRDYLDLIWSKLNSGALIIMDYLNVHKAAKEAFDDFCKVKNRPFVHIDTRYGVGIIEK